MFGAHPMMHTTKISFGVRDESMNPRQNFDCIGTRTHHSGFVLLRVRNQRAISPPTIGSDNHVIHQTVFKVTDQFLGTHFFDLTHLSETGPTLVSFNCHNDLCFSFSPPAAFAPPKAVPPARRSTCSIEVISQGSLQIILLPFSFQVVLTPAPMRGRILSIRKNTRKRGPSCSFPDENERRRRA